ncbi:myc proto-oncogene protein [Plodia interpunctella]|uniref:myc proto-oncogene protein n=1 Tax=Plodia interpunctella TaxID=58824 RepID=UPI00236750E0|nr:myc proto-oncogene protein [Plodia interpunctella]XP_053606416.1 myc proto-oncogene protein [Plodia interpunctella]
MAASIDPAILQFDIWDQLDEATMELTLTSEFWTQVQTEVDTLDMVPPANSPDMITPENESDWRILDAPEEPKKEKIVHHDCMWAGSCADSVHPGNTFVPTEQITATPGQSLLRRREPSPPRPETPPSLDGDEPPQFRHTVDVAVTARRLLRDVAADHSYTLARQNFDNLGVQTPSDSGESEEEIDVVSIGTSQQLLAASPHVRTDSLPRAPSAQERQIFQRTVASAITPRSPRPAARKRLIPPSSIASSSNVQRRRKGPGRRGRRSNTDTDSEGDCPETERRSIHNDMERLRRIGLKNLFDELKKQIPATRDKERAPKVVILREAAALCRKLREDDLQRQILKKQQDKLIAKVKKLRALTARYRAY